MQEKRSGIELAASDVMQHVDAGETLGVMTGGAAALIQRGGDQPRPAGPEHADLVDAARVFATVLLNELPQFELVTIGWAIDRSLVRPWVSIRPGEVALLLESRFGDLQLVGARVERTVH